MNPQTAARSAESVTSGRINPVSRSTETAHSRGAGSRTLEVQKTVLQEVQDSAHLKNKTDSNKTDWNHIKSNQIQVTAVPEISYSTEKPDAVRLDEIRCNPEIQTSSSIAEEYRQLIHENIDYCELLKAHPSEPELVEGIADLILETVLCRTEYILIACNSYPTEVVRSKFLKLGYWHIEYVLNCLQTNTTKVRNIKKHPLAALFNAPSTIEGYYKAEVNHDMPEFARA